MTMPHLMNCPHSGDGWCLECVGKLKQAIEAESKKEKHYYNNDYNQFNDSNCPSCTCADWGMMGCLSTCEREIYIEKKRREAPEH